VRAFSVIAGYLALTVIAFYGAMAVAGVLNADPRVVLWVISAVFATCLVVAVIKKIRGDNVRKNYFELKCGYGAVVFAFLAFKFPDIISFAERLLQI